MNTSAPPPPLPPQLPPDAQLRLVGTLLQHAEARIRPADAEGHMEPVLCLEVELDVPQRNRLHVEQPFPCPHACEAAARRYRKGMTVTVDGPVSSARMTLTHVTHIHVHNNSQPEETSA